ncbi:DUF1360 domain-containing protein [Mycobacterium sp. SMC-11]|uniref:DUF1360 domain-containing protein n=1 Tax=Mycobacterium sp. SMC-11 TaxID=3385969 RepID=UPI00390CBB74
MNDSFGHTLLILAIYVLAVARLTRLINFDIVLDPLRMWISGRAATAKQASNDASVAEQKVAADTAIRRMIRWNTLASFLSCPWCVGFWISLAGAAVPVRLLGWQWWCVIPVAFACSHLVGVGASLSEDEDFELA